ncbi:MAG: hypothetical protein HY815_32470 [Candidatus Riflebacteria bacterium]|nr:hypothetical protein [Candidatus Riflebacteria bacterium]
MRVDHASVPCAVVRGGRILLYYVDAVLGPGRPFESIGCAVSDDGLAFVKQPFSLEGLPSQKALDPSVLVDPDGRFRLYYHASDIQPGEVGDHSVRVALSDDGVNFRDAGLAFRHEALVDPDVFLHGGRWLMYVFGRGRTVIATSRDGLRFAYDRPLGLDGFGTVAPVPLPDRRLRLYAFEQRRRSGNRVLSFLSGDGLSWTQEEGVRLHAGETEAITDPFVVPFRGGYRMFFKVEPRNGTAGAPQGDRGGFRPFHPGRGLPGEAIGPGQPEIGRSGQHGPGPWDSDVNVHRVDRSGAVTHLATFDRAGVPTLARMGGGRLIVAHQHFPQGDPSAFDKVAVRFSSDEGATWTAARVIGLRGLPSGNRFPFDPTLVPLPDGRVRLYFTSVERQPGRPSPPGIHSALSADCLEYVVERGVRFALEGRPVIDCAVVLHDGLFHLFAPDNGAGTRLDQEPPDRGGADLSGYHAVSRDGLAFTRVADVTVGRDRRWLGCALSDGTEITFFGTGGGGLWSGSSPDGHGWRVGSVLRVPGADPGVVRGRDGGWIVVSTGAPRPGTPSAQRWQGGTRGRRGVPGPSSGP